jgi:hypothetical protein
MIGIMDSHCTAELTFSLRMVQVDRLLKHHGLVFSQGTNCGSIRKMVQDRYSLEA